MRKFKFRTVAAIAVFSSLAVATPAQAASICEINPDVSYYSWFAHAFGYCRGNEYSE